MSELCIINLKKHNLEFNQINELANKIVQFALDNNLAAHFNAYDYYENIIIEGQMKNFFIVSNSFLFKNCELLDTNFLDNILDIENSRLQFKNKFNFFNKLLSIIFECDITEIEIFISEGGINNINDFEVRQTNIQDFLNNLFDSIIACSDKYAYGFPSMKFEVKRM